MTDRVFFYGTLMTGFDRRRRAGIDPLLSYVGRGHVKAALFDLGIYPAAIPDPDGAVWGEVYAAKDLDRALVGLDEIEGYCPSMPETSLYNRVEVPVVYEDGTTDTVWVYFYNAPLGRAERIASGDYLEHLKVR
ncbi:MAG TPA: gamma-glutamylcyclotransferase family protein [Vicinamibacterales bacterium]